MTNQDWITTVVMVAVFCVYMYCVVFEVIWPRRYLERKPETNETSGDCGPHRRRYRNHHRRPRRRA